MKRSGFITYSIEKIGLHSLFWLGVLLFFTFFFGLEDAPFTTVFSFSAFLLPVTLVTTYTFIYYLIPRYLLPKKYAAFALYTCYTLIISSSCIVYSAFYGLVLSSPMAIDKGFPITKSLLFISIAVYLVVILACAFSLLKQNYKTSTANELLKNEVLARELQLKKQELMYLKMQIHPHFLFNTLNTLYGFALKKSDETPELILKLSNLLDYILYQTQKSKVSLKQEIEHIQDYIALEQMRFKDNLNINFECDYIADEIEIAPMVLLPFIENSFKHGKLNNGQLHVEIKLKITEKHIHFRLKNSKINHSEGKNEALCKPQQSGIGLANLQKRLALVYKNAHELKIKNEPDFYEISLTLFTTHVP
ncbi:MAG TPA: histidine kinase [Leeuwenhoekiella sp.]|nr:histidine kinase [Leeuwenhoekiella sp.]